MKFGSIFVCRCFMAMANLFDIDSTNFKALYASSIVSNINPFLKLLLLVLQGSKGFQ